MLQVGENLVVLTMVQNVPAFNVFKEFKGNASQRDGPVVSDRILLPFLIIGATLSKDQSLGSTSPVSSIVPGIKSCPAALEMLIFSNNFCTPFKDNFPIVG